jgi:YjbE family integral membrane protein
MNDVPTLALAGVEFAYLAKLTSVVWVDIILSGDNALVIGIAASTLPKRLQRRAIVFGLVLATAIRIAFAAAATFLLAVPGLLVVGGLALLWVSYRLGSELLGGASEAGEGEADMTAVQSAAPASTLARALVSITIADISMSIDNVLAVAAIVREHVELLVFGLALSIGLMGFGATLILKLMRRFPWISYLGVGLLVVIGGEMIYEGWPDLHRLAGGVAASAP